MNDTEEKILIRRIGKFATRLAGNILSDSIPLKTMFAKSDGEIGFEDRESLKYNPLDIGDKWGERWEVGWFKCTVDVPESHRGRMAVLRVDIGGEGLVYKHDGTILQGISSGSVFENEFNRDLIHLGTLLDDIKQIEVWVEGSACGLFGMFTEQNPKPDSPKRYGHYDADIRKAELCLFDRDSWHLWLDIEAVRGILSALPESSTRRARLLNAVSDVNDLYDRGGAISGCRDRLADEFQHPASSSELSVAAVGHAHIDTAWLWPVRETVRKCARTFASQLDLLDKYPDYVFGASQPQHYKFIKEHYPELYKRISQAVDNGRWEVQGGMWVEADCNLISGESMIRQILHGKNFFRDELGVDVNNLWLPDVFGYSPSLPQILKRSGIDYFLTQKMSWSQYNKFPHHTFNWQGIDGTQVLAHFPPEDTYNSTLRAESLIRGAAQFKECGYVDEFMCLFGVGDGGGGPKEEHVEFGQRFHDTEGVPKVRFGTASGFFSNMEKYRERLPVWVGELYLELHRGTLTTQARNKKWNRKLEYRLQNTEILWSCLDIAEYPSEILTELWETLLQNQFHDILPGSSITSVYNRTEKEYEQIDREINDLQQRAVEHLFERDDDALVIFNPSSYEYTETIALPSQWKSVVSNDVKSKSIPVQSEQGISHAMVTVKPFQFLTLKKSNGKPSEVAVDSELILENELVRYEFDSSGQLIGAYDKEIDREIAIPDNPGNVLTLYEDRPNDWDAWDIDRTYESCVVTRESANRAPTRISGPIRQILNFDLTVGNSSVEQSVVLMNGSRRLDFRTRVEWRESHKMLRVAFPVDIFSEDASFDIQYGYIKRPTHRNTSWDLARFEVVAHRYADISEPDYGVALLNDCKYGHRVVGNTLDLCLLRSPKYPDPDADMGTHEFTYGYLPHRGDLVRSNVMAQASALNNGLLSFSGYSAGTRSIPVRISGSGIAVGTIKRAEKDNCLIIRVVETNGCRSRAVIECDSDVNQIEECDLMEWKTLGPVTDKAITLNPFEIKTLKIWLK